MSVRTMFAVGAWITAISTHSTAAAGPFPPFGDSGVPTSSVTAWANQAIEYDPAPGVMDTPGFPEGSPDIPNDVPERALGPADGVTVSLGDLSAERIAAAEPPGTITVSFGRQIFNGPGPDLAIFENAGEFFSASYIYAELAFAEVSSNGVDFARFPATSLNVDNDGDMVLESDELDISFGRDFAGIDTTNVHNLAGVHPTLTGTPFDLAELTEHDLVNQGLLDLNAVRFVRLVDIPGNGQFLDSQGNPILDAWETTVSGGLDLDAVGAIHSIPEPAGTCLAACGITLLLLARYNRSPE